MCPQLNNSVYELYVPESEVDMDIIFFHGLDFGDTRDASCRAWRSGDGTECWPQNWLPEQFPGARIMAVSYDASVWETDTSGRLDMELIAEILRSDLILSDSPAVGQALYRPLVPVGHSVGGLVIEQLCMHASRRMQLSASRDDFEHKK